MSSIKYKIWMLLPLMAMISCESILDKFPEDKITPETFFTTENELELYSNNFYVACISGTGVFKDYGDVIIQPILEKAISASQAPPAHHDFRQGFRAGVNHGGIFFLHAQGRTAAADITRHRGNILYRNHGQGFDSHGPGGLFQGEFRINGNDEYVVLAGSPLRHQSLVHPFRRQSQGRRRVPGVHKFRTFIRIMPVRNMKRVQQPHGIGFDIPFLFPGHKS